MGSKLIVTKKENKIISSLYENGEMVQVYVEGIQSQYALGNIYLGKVKNIVKNINAAFVEIEKGLMCYLSLEENKAPIFANVKKNATIVAGDEIIVQITKEQMKTKAPVVSSNINITGKYVVLTHGKKTLGISTKIKEEKVKNQYRELLSYYKGREFGLIIRTNAQFAPIEAVVSEIEQLVKQYQKIKLQGVHKTCYSLILKSPMNYLCEIRDGMSNDLEEIITDEEELYNEMQEYLENFQKEDNDKLSLYHNKLISLNSLYSIESKLKKALQPKVWLKSGGYLVIEPTEALTVIDVNTGKAIAGKRAAEETFYRINMEAVKEITKQIRLRNLSGIILIDFIDMKAEEYNQKIMEELRSLVEKDSVKTTVVDMTALHLVEMTRKKVRKPLHEQLSPIFLREELQE